VFFIHPERVLRADACRQHGDPLHRAAASFNQALQRTAAPLGSRIVQVILAALVEQTGCTERRDRAAALF
jgi:hypothetical protein